MTKGQSQIANDSNNVCVTGELMATICNLNNMHMLLAHV